jgi:hypothetical protein
VASFLLAASTSAANDELFMCGLVLNEASRELLARRGADPARTPPGSELMLSRCSRLLLPTPTPGTTKRTRRKKKCDLLACWASIKAWDASVAVHSQKSRGQSQQDSMRTMTVQGSLLQPVRDVSEICIMLAAEAEPTLAKSGIPSIGSIIATKPAFSLVVRPSETEFQYSVALATSGRLRSMHLCFQEPRHGSALIESCSLGTRPAEAR